MSKMTMCLSGGAQGADKEWGYAAIKAGHELVHWIFDGYSTRNLTNYSILGKEKLDVADQYLVLANKSLKRRWPTRNAFANNLLRRNYYQIQWSDSVYAISKFDKDSSLLNVSGGTAWACQMYVDRWLYADENANMASCKLYLFDQTSNGWYQWQEEWSKIDAPPTPSGVYAGIGSRELTKEGKRAIHNLYL